MTSSPVRIPPFFLDFMHSVKLNRHDHIVMRANAYAADDTCLELDVRLHSTEPDLRYIVGYVNEHSCFNHPETGEKLFKALLFTKTLDFPDDTQRIDDYYLGPFSEEMMLEVMAAADHTSARLDADKRVSYCQKQLEDAQKIADGYRESSRDRGSIVSDLTALEKITKYEERRGLFTLLQGGKSDTPKMG